MSKQSGNIELAEKVGRLERRGRERISGEHSIVAATGATAAAWTIKVVSLDSHNLYNVRQVLIGSAGSNPAVVGGSDTTAFNIAESFTATGSVAAGTYAVMWRVGGKNVFYAVP